MERAMIELNLLHAITHLDNDKAVDVYGGVVS